MRRALCLLLLIAGGACFTRGAKPWAVTLAPNAYIDSTGERIQLRMAARPDLAAIRVVEALVRQDLRVMRNQGGIVEASLPREVGVFGTYDIVVRAYVYPSDAGGSNVQLIGEEGVVTGPNTVIWQRLNDRKRGRALATWKKLREVGAELGR